MPADMVVPVVYIKIAALCKDKRIPNMERLYKFSKPAAKFLLLISIN